MAEWPSIYKYKGRWWFGGIETVGNKGGLWNLWREFWWLARHGEWCCGWQHPKWVFGVGRTWHDGPIWFARFGFFSVDLGK